MSRTNRKFETWINWVPDFFPGRDGLSREAKYHRPFLKGRKTYQNYIVAWSRKGKAKVKRTINRAERRANAT